MEGSKDFDEFIHELCRKPIEEIVDEVAEDYTLRSYLASCAENYRNGADFDRYNYENREPGHDWDWCHFWETTQFLTGWTWRDREEFETEADRTSIAFWAPKILRALSQRMNSQHARDVQEEIDRKEDELKKKEDEKRAELFSRNIPEQFKDASLDKLSAGFRQLAERVENGHSYLIYSAPGAGKTFFSYALAADFIRKGKNCSREKLFQLLQRISKEAMNSRYTADEIIDMDYVKSCDLLILDECDKVEQKDTAFRNFSYLIDRRCEELMPTIILCNAADGDDLAAKLGSSVCDRFRSKKWKAHIINGTPSESRRGEEAS